MYLSITICRANSDTQLPETTREEVRVAGVYRRFYAALQLRDLCNEIPIYIVARNYESTSRFRPNVSSDL